MVDLLLVDDEPSIRLVVGDALRAAGHQVSIAEDGAVALNLLAERRFDVIVSDIKGDTARPGQFHHRRVFNRPHAVLDSRHAELLNLFTHPVGAVEFASVALGDLARLAEP